MHLMGAVIAPSEEDSQTFNVNAANGEIYKLRAHDAKERQYWVSGNLVRRLLKVGFRCVSFELPFLPRAFMYIFFFVFPYIAF